MVPGPVVNGMVRGKKATSGAPEACAACPSLRSSWSSAADSIVQAWPATTAPPAMRRAESEMPKKSST